MNPGRAIAMHVLCRVLKDSAYAAAVLQHELDRAKNIDPRDISLATEIVFGTLRVAGKLDERLQALQSSPRPLPPAVRAALWAACYQILHLQSTAPFAVVSETVTWIKEQTSPKVGGFANAILRKVAADRPAEPKPPTSIEVTSGLRQVLVQGIGEERTEQFLAGRVLPPPLALRVSLETARDEAITLLKAARPNADLEPGLLSPLCILARRLGSTRELGKLLPRPPAIQDEGAQLIALALGAKEGDSVADLCSGRGGKTSLFLQAVGETGSVAAIDLYEDKLGSLKKECKRLGFDTSRLETHAVDLTIGTGDATGPFDRVMVDAPCTGLGTIHRRPEILLRLRPEDPARMAALQFTILEKGAQIVGIGGLLIYAVCSLSREEGPDVAARFSAAHPDFTPVTSLPYLEDARSIEEGFLIGPWMDPRGLGPDGYRLFAWRRV